MAFGLPELAAAVRQFCQDNLPGRTPLRIRIYTLEDEQPLQLPVVSARAPRDDPGDVFVPNAFQTAILEALEGKAMKTGALAAAVHCETPQLFKKPKGGIAELREHDLVRHHERLGYWRPDAPPPQLSEPG